MPTPKALALVAQRIRPVRSFLLVAFLVWLWAFLISAMVEHFSLLATPRIVWATVAWAAPAALIAILLNTVSVAFDPTDGRFSSGRGREHSSTLQAWSLTLTLLYLLAAVCALIFLAASGRAAV